MVCNDITYIMIAEIKRHDGPFCSRSGTGDDTGEQPVKRGKRRKQKQRREKRSLKLPPASCRESSVLKGELFILIAR
jgi:hypothetical protein